MVSVASLFAQALSLISRHDFAKAVRQRGAEKAAKGFSCWDQFVAMLFCQLGGANSLREICGGLATAMGKLRHLGLSQAPSRSTLSYANSHRPWELFEDVFHSLLGQAQVIAGRYKRKFRFKNPLRSIDASTIGRIYKERWQIEMCQSYYGPCHTFYHMEVLNLGWVRLAA